MNRVFLDANVFFSAAHMPKGVPAAIFDEAQREDRDISLLTVPLALIEAERNVRDKIPHALSEYRTLPDKVWVCPYPTVLVVLRLVPLVSKFSDRVILASAVSAGADWFVTGDRKDFGHLWGSTVEGVLVLRPRDAVDYLRPPT